MKMEYYEHTSQKKKILIKVKGAFYLVDKDSTSEFKLDKSNGEDLLKKRTFDKSNLVYNKINDIRNSQRFKWLFEEEKEDILKRIECGPIKHSTPGVYVCGDTHNNIDLKKINDWDSEEGGLLTKDDILIVLGDWGGILGKTLKGVRKDEKIQRKWIRKPYTLIVQLGNHENYDKIKKLPKIEKYGGLFYEKKIYTYDRSKYLGSILLMMRGEIYTIYGKTFFSMGGARSYSPNVDFYWEDLEVANSIEIAQAYKNLERFNFKVDYVITHTCPLYVGKELMTYFKPFGRCISTTTRYNAKINFDPMTELFEDIAKKTTFKAWHFGHWHLDQKIGEKYQCHYNGRPLRLL